MYYIKKYFKVIIIFICVIILGVGFLVSNFFFNKDNENNKENDALAVLETTNSSSTSVNSSNFYIDIKGEVKNPGVYFVSDGMIVEDAITLAGGLTKNAYTDNINLSLKLTTEMVIYIYNKKDITTVPITTKIINDAEVTSTNSIVTSKSTSTSISTSTNTSGSVNESTTNSLVNINTANKEEIMSLPGIGESKANKIIAYRDNNKFTTIEDIKNVSGIGDSLFESIKDYITV